MTDKEIINSKNSQKMSVYCKTCICKSCEQVAWLEQENAELKAENATLKANSNVVQTYITQNQQLKTHLSGLEKKNARLKAENERLQKLTCFNCGEETLSPSGAEIYDKILVYKQTLQEIKEIAEQSNVDCIYRISVIRKILTKAEEE